MIDLLKSVHGKRGNNEDMGGILKVAVSLQAFGIPLGTSPIFGDSALPLYKGECRVSAEVSVTRGIDTTTQFTFLPLS